MCTGPMEEGSPDKFSKKSRQEFDKEKLVLSGDGGGGNVADDSSQTSLS